MKSMKLEKPRILWDAKDSPTLPSGYGILTKYLTPYLSRAFGERNVLIYAPVYQHDAQGVYKGMKVLAGMTMDYGENLLEEHYSRNKCNVLIMVGDWFQFSRLPELASNDQILWIQWGPADFLNIPPELKTTIHFAYKVVPFSQDSENRFKQAGLGNVAPYIPLGINTNVWTPGSRQNIHMNMAKFDEKAFNILIVAANQRRKYVREQLEGIALFRKATPDAKVRVYLHSAIVVAGERNLEHDLVDLKLEDVVTFPDQYLLAQGGIPETDMAGIFRCADVVVNACMEGWGYAVTQAQAVGVPAIVLSEGGTTEQVKFGSTIPPMAMDYAQMLVKPIPSVIGIAESLQQIAKLPEADRQRSAAKAVEHVRSNYSWPIVGQAWVNVIRQAMVDRYKFSMSQPVPSAMLRKRAASIVKVNQS